ncbi:MAG: acyltransferase family protein [Myxococcales bacterium]|nr:acyltransferase family protein [Myxococcales bacterium]
MSAPSEHRADVDGWRALAVTLVVLFHAWPALVPGGFVGVDVFFVISGFVMTRLVQRHEQASTFSVSDFYLRRINRLAPALLVVVVATLVAAVLLLSPSLVALVVAHAAAGLAMVVNVLLAAQASYFDVTAEVKPLLHLWSLAVEEQFYLVVPLAVVLTRRRPGVRVTATLVLSLSSLAASVVLTASAPTWAYYLPITRAWELLAGVLVAQRSTTLAAGHRMAREGLALLGLGCVLAAAIGFDKTTPFPGAWALLPVGGTVLLLWTGPQTRLARLVSHPRVVWLGLVSYPLYLWHWPVLTLSRLSVPLEQTIVVTPLAIIASLALAWATFTFVERPVRARQSRLVAGGLVMAAATLGVGVTTLQLTNGIERWSGRGPEAAKVSRFERDYEYLDDARFGTCWLLDEPAKGDASTCIEEAPPELPLVMVWGDSHAARFSAGLRALQAERRAFRVAQRTRSSCPPLLDLGSRFCRDANQSVILEAGALRPAVLVLDARWTEEPRASQLRATLQQLHTAVPETKLVVVGPAPEWRVSLPWALNKRAAIEAIPERLRPDAFERQREVEAQLAAAAKENGATFVSALDALCTLEDGCLVRLSEEPLMLTTWDYGHLTTPAAKLVARRVALAW